VGRILAVDYGMKRTGLAVTDPLKIIATALVTVETQKLLNELQTYLAANDVESFVVGIPKHLNNTDADIVPEIERFIKKLEEFFPGKPVYRVDERFTSKIAQRSMIESGQNRKTRRDKSVIDKLSAAIILQSWLEQKK
jgi:putative holliday junction resolvase